MIRRLGMGFALLLAACTAGGIPTSSGGGGGVTIQVSLTQFAQQPTPYGSSLGYSPAVTTIAVGSQIHFVNVDSFQHTATLLKGFTSFPSGSPLGGAAETQSGSALSSNWSSGVLQPSSSSQTITADVAGTYLFGCYFHYSGGMRAAIVAQ
ncbi:MAG: plastocyanin/azurin family copper-binding protein [Candidatus Cybelea sp.]|jgi:plastocyanin